MSNSAAPNLLIRADADPHMGTGHIMRCLALAQWARRAGVAATLMGRIAVPWVAERLKKDGLPFIPLDGAVPAVEKPEKLLGQIQTVPGADWVVLDGYHFDTQCQKVVRHAGYKLLLIDDYAHLPEYSCDILLNQNLGAERLCYAGDVGTFLLGPRYALLRPEFAEARERALARVLPPEPHTLLLTLGGGNCIKHLRRIAPCFMMSELAGRTLRIVRGSMDTAEIQAALHGCPADIEVLHQVDDMPSLFLDTDLCITAGGSTCWELCCLGVPFLAVEIAENQRDLIAELFKILGVPPLSASTLLAALKKKLSLLRKRLTAACPGEGAVMAFHALENTPFILRQAMPQDNKLILHLANEPGVRATSFSPHPITEQKHDIWLELRLAQGDSPFYLAFDKEKLVGYVRFDADSSKSFHTVTIAVSSSYRGKGFGTTLLRRACSLAWIHGVNMVVAFVRSGNMPSAKAFIAAGFIRGNTEQQKGYKVIRYTHCCR